MTSSGGNSFNFSSKSDGQFYMINKGRSQTYSQGSMMYSHEVVNMNPLPQSSNSIIHEDSAQLRGMPVKVEQNSPVFVMSSNPSQSVHHHQSLESKSPQQMAYSHLSSSASVNVDPQSQQAFPSSYSNLTSWTTKYTTQDLSSFPPPSTETLSIPMMSGRQSSLPAAAGPIHLSSRMHKATPYHNAFSRISPLQPKPVSKSQNFQGSQPDAMAAVLPMNSSGELVLKSIPSRENRFKRTAEALHKSGLWEVAMKTGNLIKRNQELQKELEQFKMDALNFLKSVIKNPENRDFIKSVLNNALSAGATERKKSSVMTVVVSAAAAAAAAAIKYEPTTEQDSGVGSDGSGSCVGYNNSIVSDKSVSNMSSADISASLQTELNHHTGVA